MYIFVDMHNLYKGVQAAISANYRFSPATRANPVISADGLAQVVGWEEGPLVWHLASGEATHLSRTSSHNFLNPIPREGWTVTRYLRTAKSASGPNGQSRKANCDIIIAWEVARVVYTIQPSADNDGRRIVLVTGDGDFTYLADATDAIIERGFLLAVASFKGSLSKEWRARRRHVHIIELDNHLDRLILGP